jgi:hypothetical protein
MGNEGTCDPKIANVALQKLRDASEQLPVESEDDEIKHILKEVTRANDAISKCEKSYQEQADLLNKTIAHSISNFVDKEVARMEEELKDPVRCNPLDDTSIDRTYQELMIMKKKLVHLFDLVSRWGWSHLRRVQRERIAEVYEKVDFYASKTGKVLGELAVHCPENEKNRLMKFHDSFQTIVDFGSDRINPDEIFTNG